MMLLPRSNSWASDSFSLESASCRMGTEEALKARTKGGVVPGGAERSWVWEMPVICAYASSSFTFGWKKYLTTEVPVRDCDSVCSTSLTVVCALRSVPRMIRVAISSGARPVYRQIVATTGILMFGKMSVGVRRIANTPSSVIAMASTRNVYGRRSASLTIHMARPR